MECGMLRVINLDRMCDGMWCAVCDGLRENA